MNMGEWSVVPSFAKPAKLGQPQLLWRWHEQRTGSVDRLSPT
jgi:hypothetical protein